MPLASYIDVPLENGDLTVVFYSQLFKAELVFSSTCEIIELLTP